MQPMRMFALFVCTVFLLVGSAEARSVKKGTRKISIEKMLAGYSLEKSDHVTLRDATTGYYLIRSGMCDGGHRHLALCTDLKAQEDWGPFDLSNVKPVKLRNLQTGRGIRMGDTLARIKKIMGEPTWEGSSRYTPGEKVVTYHHLIGTHKDGTEYTTLFRLREGRVTGIELGRDTWPG